MPLFKAAALQLTSLQDPETNLEEIRAGLQAASASGATFVALPENFAFMGNEEEKRDKAESISKRVLRQLPQWAKQYRVGILAGGFPVKASAGKVYNRSLLISSRGEVLAHYDKIHLFDVTLSEHEAYMESRTVEAGSPKAVSAKIELLDLSGNTFELHVGFSICYDLRFPELYRSLVIAGADLITIPAAFTRPTGEAHWEVLLRARAIENSLFVIAPAQTGIHTPSRSTYGHSMIIDPWGGILANAGTAPGFISAEIDTEMIRNVRKKLPSLSHRRISEPKNNIDDEN